ncbi:RNA-splicing ligase RtcB [Methanosarcinales archaeon]|nr:MAG: RNA-splicing ligase RtcB [Methanosarcinales archaeon]
MQQKGKMPKLDRVTDYIWDIPIDYMEKMRVPGRLFLSSTLLKGLEIGTLNQTANVATLPGIRKYSMAMPDAHPGYGFPIGGVAAFDSEDGVISPGGVGFDINCGVRVIRTNLTENDVRPKIRKLVDALFRSVPSGVGAKSKLKVSDSELRSVFEDGAGWAVEQGYGVSEDLEHCEENGAIKLPGELKVSDKVMKRGRPQLGTLGSGNHFLEVQCVSEIYDQDIADSFGIHKGDITIMIHCGSRGAGHQICTEHLRVLEKAARKYEIELVDRQLACAPVQSKEGQEYFTAMCAGANYAWANRQVITHWVRETFQRFFGDIEMDLVYDVAHNVAKLEEHTIDGKSKMVYVHRKGATRAFPAGHPDVPKAYRDVGQPVLIPGSMGTPSYILCGMERAMELTFGSACHGAGRVGSRKAALRKYKGAQIEKELLAKGITVKATHPSVLAEEAPAVYKPSGDVVDVVHRLGVACKVAQVVPIGVAKG